MEELRKRVRTQEAHGGQETQRGGTEERLGAYG